jgi:tocopherol cyclase
LAPADQHAFVQVINGKTGQTWYFRYPLSAFYHAGDEFYIQVGESSFSANMMDLTLDSPHGKFSGKLSFSQTTPFTTSLLKPGIMGWYRYVPFMECYHGLVSLDHLVNGSLHANGEHISFIDGKGYTEKDWGRSMPEAWIWMQTNCFSKPQTSFMLSVAKSHG